MSRPRFSVSCVRCGSYERQKVQEAVKELIEMADGFPEIDSRVLIKANLLSPREPSENVTTHPEVVRAISLFLSKAREIEIADNPGYIFRGQEKELLERTGMTGIQEEGLATAGLLSRKGFRELCMPEAVSLKCMRVSETVLQVPFVIDVPKLKTHVETEITGSIKNMFGISDTWTRKKAHGIKNHVFLLNAVIDIYLARVPDFCILDAIEGMDGNGPSRGRSVSAGWLAASDNALAIDIIQAAIMGYRDPFSVPLLKIATERLDGPRSKDDIEINGATWEELPVPGFRKASGSVRMIPAFLRGMAHSLVTLKPGIAEAECTKCGICIQVCPVKAISIGDTRFPVIDPVKCVQCLCCHEMCPTGAMKVKESLLSRLTR